MTPQRYFIESNILGKPVFVQAVTDINLTLCLVVTGVGNKRWPPFINRYIFPWILIKILRVPGMTRVLL